MSETESVSGQTLSALAKYGFVDLSATVGKLDQLVAIVGDVGRTALTPISRSANPDQALDYLIRIAEIDKNQVKKILAREKSAEALLKILGASTALADFIIRHNDQLGIFLGKRSFSINPEKLVKELAMGLSVNSLSSSEYIALLRKNYRSALLQIAVYDLSAVDPSNVQPEVSAALSDIAAGALDLSIELARKELVSTIEYGRFTEEEVRNTSLAVIGMGKCGARELNYISDVDVIFVAESKSAELDNDRMLQVATKLASRMMRIMDTSNPEPALWEVDANLRPEGKSGALVRTLESHLAYYSRWAENWEFQALLKARAIAGDLELGRRYEAEVSPLVWQSSRRENFVESVQRMRERVSENIPSAEVEWQIKLGAGGLRDIEFTVQLLQLVHGRDHTEVRAADTATAINQLALAGFISRDDAAAFAKHYRFLRVIEHRVQLKNLRRSHLMPADKANQRLIARAIDPGFSSDKLVQTWLNVKQEVRSLHQQIFYRPLLIAAAKTDGQVVLSSDEARERLLAIGFLNPDAAAKHIESLTGGLSRRAQIQKQLLPILIEWFAKGSDPDNALLAFRRLSENLGDSPWYLRMLRDSAGAAEQLSLALANSRFVTELFEQIPEGAAWLENSKLLAPTSIERLWYESDSLSSRHSDVEEFAKAIRHIRRREALRLGLSCVAGQLVFEDLSVALSNLSDWYVACLVKKVLEELEYSGEKIEELLDIGLVAMGRSGGQELGFGSDLDAMVIYDVRPGMPVALAQKAAEMVVSEVRKLSRDPLLEFEIDLDLRPEGKNGPVARSIDSYRAYYARWGDVWENQALLRARMFFGSIELQRNFEELVNLYRYPFEIEQKSIVEIRRIKARMEAERLPQGVEPKRHLKLGPGSLSDVEWVVQLVQLRYGNLHPEIRTPRTLEALAAMVEVGLIEKHDATVLREAWEISSRIRSAIVLATNKRSDLLPIDRKALEAVSRVLGYPRGSASVLEEEYLAKTRRSRMVFERLFFA